MVWNYYALEKLSQERQSEMLQAAKRDRLIAAASPGTAHPTPSPLFRMGALLIDIGQRLQGNRGRLGDLS